MNTENSKINESNKFFFRDVSVECGRIKATL